MRDWDTLGHDLVPDRDRGHPETWVASQAIWGQPVDPADRLLRFRALVWVLENRLNEMAAWRTPAAGEIVTLRVLLDELGRREGWEDPGDRCRGLVAAQTAPSGILPEGVARRDVEDGIEAARAAMAEEGRAWAAANGITLDTLLAVFD